MSFRSSADSNCLLSYGITTNPDPLQASPAVGNPSLGSILVTVSNNTVDSIYCNSIVFSFEIGTDAQDLASTADGILVSANSSDDWQITETAAGVFTATPVKPENNLISTQGLSFQVYNIQVNNQVGTFNFYVTEDSAKDNNQGSFSKKSATYELSKFPYGFYVNNFAAKSPLVNDGETATLTWSGSDLAEYTIYYDTSSANVSNQRSWTSPPLKNTTTFALQATSQVDGQIAETDLYVTVIVANPELSVTSLNVAQGTTLTGATTIGSTLNVTGNTTLTSLSAGAANIGGDLSANNITGNQVTAAYIDSNQGLGVAGTAYINDMVVSGSLAIKNTVSMMTYPQQIQQGTYYAYTDGFVVAQVTGPGDGSQRSFGTVFGSTANMSFSCHGGSYSGLNNYTWTLNESFTMPVSKGQNWNVGLWNDGSNKADSTGAFWWIPIGATQNPSATFEKISDEVPEYKVPAAVQTAMERAGNAQKDITEFINMLSTAFNQQLSDDAKAKLEKQLMKMTGNDHVPAKPAPVL